MIAGGSCKAPFDGEIKLAYGECRIVFPETIMQHIGGKELEPNKVGCSRASVYKVISSPGMYLKIAESVNDIDELIYESNLLAWLGGKLPVPQVIATASEGNEFFLLMSEVEGVPAHDALWDDKERYIKALAQGLLRIHSIDIACCPFDQRLNVKLLAGASNIREGIVDESDFDDDTQGLTAQEVLDRLLDTRPDSEDLVFTHGDYCLPNIIVKDGCISGFIDMGRGGVSDRYQDLALALRSLKYNLRYFGGMSWSADDDRLFLDEYGIGTDGFDPVKAAYYRLLDELF